MSSQRWWTAAGVVLVTGLGVLGAVDRSAAGPDRHRRSGSLPVTDTTVVCPDVASGPLTPTTMSIASAGRLAGISGSTTITQINLGSRTKPLAVQANPVYRVAVKSHLLSTVAIRAQGPGAAGLVADQQQLVAAGSLRGLRSTACTAPATDFWFVGTDGRIGFSDTLVLANPGSTLANLTVSAWAATGRVKPPKLQSFTLAPHQAQQLNVADYVPDKATVTLHVHANSGRVTAALSDSRVAGIQAAGLDWLPPTHAPAQALVIPGVPGGAGPRDLVLTNPGTADATVSLRLSTNLGNFVPAARPSLVVAAGHSLAVDLGPAFAGAPGAMLLSSDRPIVAAALADFTASGRGSLPDIAWLPATEPLTAPGVLLNNTPPFGTEVRLFLTAPQAAATVRVVTSSGAAKQYVVPAGRTLAIDYGHDLGTSSYPLLVLTPVRGGPLYASRLLAASGAHGPLATSEPPTVLPVPIPLPPAVEDLRAALLP